MGNPLYCRDCPAWARCKSSRTLRITAYGFMALVSLSPCSIWPIFQAKFSARFSAISRAPNGQAEKEERSRKLPNTKTVIAGVESTRVRLDDGSIEGQRSEVERIDQALDHCGTAIALQLCVANIGAVLRCEEEAIDAAGLCLRRTQNV
jgi:hypothetical protein